MKKYHFKLLIVNFTFCISSMTMFGCARMVGLGPLAEVSQAEELAVRQAAKETKSFIRLKKYILAAKLKKGISIKSARRKFGEPVVKFSEYTPQRWVYKRGDTDWIGSEKIYLFFEGDKLTRWEIVNPE